MVRADAVERVPTVGCFSGTWSSGQSRGFPKSEMRPPGAVLRSCALMTGRIYYVHKEEDLLVFQRGLGQTELLSTDATSLAIVFLGTGHGQYDGHNPWAGEVRCAGRGNFCSNAH